MVVKTRVVQFCLQSSSGNFGRMKNFACRYPLHVRRENVEALGVAGMFS